MPRDRSSVDHQRQQADVFSHAWTRRQLLFAGGALFLAGCSGARAAPGPIHTVGAGESLSSIAALYGISLEQLLHYNRLSGRVLQPGQQVYLPPGATRIAPPKPEPVAAPTRRPRVRRHQIVSRAQWGAPQAGNNWDMMGTVAYVTLHHTDEYPGMRGLPDDQVVQNICNYHRRLGWADIGYHYLVGRDGRIYEGRRVDRQGAHAGGDNNRHNLGISLIGNFEQQLPGSAQLQATRGLLQQQLAHYGLPRKRLLGHREWSPTVCPGDALFAWMQDYRAGRLA